MAALAAQVLAVGEQAAGPGALQRQPRVYEGGGAAVVVHEKRLEKQTTVFCLVVTTSVKLSLHNVALASINLAALVVCDCD